MKKKIFIVISILLLVITLVSCKSLLGGNTAKYSSNDDYEKLVINNADKINSTTVSLINSDNENSAIGSAVVYKKDKGLTKDTFYAITSANIIIENGKKLRVLTSRASTSEVVTSYTYNEEYGIGLIEFKSNFKLNVAEISDASKLSKVEIGQTITSIGTTANLDNFNTFKTGIVTNLVSYNNLQDYAFTHDAANNAGELGSGVFNLEGKLIGINIEKKYYKTKLLNGTYNVLGLNTAVKIDRIANSLDSLKIDEQSVELPNSFFESNNNEYKETNYSSYEKAIIEVNKKVSPSIATIVQGVEYATGLVYKKNNNTYSILTKKFESTIGMIISVNGKEYSNLNLININDKISVIELNTADDILVYNSTVINSSKGIELVNGQKILTVGTIDSRYVNSLNQGTLSKNDFTNQIFMHDGKFNLGQEGAPIFNLNGELLGINLYKENTVTTSEGEIVAEGLGYAYNINYLVPELLNLENELEITNLYQSNVDYEKKIIDVVNKAYDSTVTVSTETGHGSGIIFKKEVVNNVNRYYVLTNEHVVEKAKNISISFNGKNNYITALDYQTTTLYDMSIVRFESVNDYQVYNSKVINNDENIGYSIGQTAIAIGTPMSDSLNGYVTVGSLSTTEKQYRTVSKLGLIQDVAINPGNSGGPLFNLNGELMGLNVSKLLTYDTSKGRLFAERVGTSLNINVLKTQVNYSTYLTMTKTPKLGVKISQVETLITNKTLSEDEMNKIARHTDGLVVVGTDEARGSYNQLLEYDLIIAAEGRTVRTQNDLVNIVSNMVFGQEYSVKVLRNVNNKTQEITVKVVIK
ncbi:trypsin-like peptidase domain-containing protein [Haploplasma axanthum]|uniref:Probable periplasmic serine endoprotease DegP-like n=1 Tax=Haploplasma axanthum TaxID=29552 RepID=A0A449BCN1_HAPAX|nr:trypsin-like peptidase domain-containing protein [Haploplasma axanthum]VEU80211.1 Probable periplasmic serine endoprotease DegP-like precursor [Haploplasma axanthum]